MTLDKDSWFVKYWLWFGFRNSTYSSIVSGYRSTDICQVGRVMFIWAPLKLFFFVLLPVFLVGSFIYRDPVGFSIAVGFSIGFILLSVGSIWLIDRFLRSRTSAYRRPSVVAEWIRAKKNKYCTIIDVE